ASRRWMSRQRSSLSSRRRSPAGSFPDVAKSRTATSPSAAGVLFCATGTSPVGCGRLVLRGRKLLVRGAHGLLESSGFESRERSLHQNAIGLTGHNDAGRQRKLADLLFLLLDLDRA